jgi:hypothetical protein
MALPPHLTISFDGIQFDRLLEDWRWLIQSNSTPILMTAFGDLFLRDPVGHIYFLDLMAGEFKEVAPSEEEFERLCDAEENRRTWFGSLLIPELQNVCGDLGLSECFGCKTPLSLGGQFVAENFERSDLEVHYSVLGQLHQQTKGLPEGTKIGRIAIEPTVSPKPKNWWQRLIR